MYLNNMEREEDKTLTVQEEEEEEETEEAVVVEYRVPMHCNACERLVAKTISKFQGVEQFTTQKQKHKVVVTGHIDPLKLLKKLRKKTRKKQFVEIVEPAANVDGEEAAVAAGGCDGNIGNCRGIYEQRMVDGSSSGLEMGMAGSVPNQCYCYYHGWPPPSRREYYDDDAVVTAFSDENPNACSLM